MERHVYILLPVFLLLVPYPLAAYAAEGAGGSGLHVETLVRGYVSMKNANGTWSIGDEIRAEFTVSFVNESFYRATLDSVDISLNGSPESAAKIFEVLGIPLDEGFIVDADEMERLVSAGYGDNLILSDLYGGLSPSYKYVVGYLASTGYEMLNKYQAYAALVTSPLSLADTLIYASLSEEQKLPLFSYLSFQVGVYDTPELFTLTTGFRSQFGRRDIIPLGIEVYEGVPLEHYLIRHREAYGIGESYTVQELNIELLTLPNAPIFLFTPVSYKVNATVRHYRGSELTEEYVYRLEGSMKTDYKAFMGAPRFNVYLYPENKGYILLTSWSSGEAEPSITSGGEETRLSLRQLEGAPLAIGLCLSGEEHWLNYEAEPREAHVTRGILSDLENASTTYLYLAADKASTLNIGTPRGPTAMVDLSKNTVDIETLSKTASISTLNIHESSSEGGEEGGTTPTENNQQNRENAGNNNGEPSSNQPATNTHTNTNNKNTKNNNEDIKNKASETLNKIEDLARENKTATIGLAALLILTIAIIAKKK